MTATTATEELWEEAHSRVSCPLQPRELRGELVAGTTFLSPLPDWRCPHPGKAIRCSPPHWCWPTRSPPTSASTSATGFTVPTQLAVVPMFLLLRPGDGPAARRLAGNVVSELPEYVQRHKRHPQRALVALGNSWYAVGPAVVLVVAGHSPSGALDALARLPAGALVRPVRRRIWR